MVAAAALTAEASTPDVGRKFVCPPAPQAIVELSIGSRYQKGSRSRSDIDPEANKRVDAALRPVDKFIGDLAEMANSASTDQQLGHVKAACVLSWLDTWAEAGALTELDSFNARLAVAARIGAMAIALWQVEDDLPASTSQQQRRTEAWLVDRGNAVRRAFDQEAGAMSKQNNLRAWAGLATIAIGNVANDRALLDWGAKSFELVTCKANANGSLPEEMKRKQLALHYQLHAVNALVMSAYMLRDSGWGSYDVCGGKLDDIVEFTFQAVMDTSVVDKLAGVRQTYSTGKEQLEGFELAWAEPYLAVRRNAELDRYVQRFRPLTNSKLGGNLTAMLKR